MTMGTGRLDGQVDDFYVYTWTRPDTGNVFYVGKGRGGRSETLQGRNKHFRNVVAKVREAGLEPIVSKVADALSEQRAFDLEVELIAKYGRSVHGGTLVNQTDGGEGASGALISAATRAKKSSGMRSLLENQQMRKKWSDAQRKRYQDLSQREKSSAALVKRYKDPDERRKTAAALRGKPKAKNHVENVRIALVGAWKNEDLRDRHRLIRLTSGPSKANRSGYKGVSFDKSKGKWLAQIEVNGKNKHLGRYHSAEDAARAYDNAAVLHYGSEVYLNFPNADNDNYADVPYC